MLKGWITANQDDKDFLESLGVKLGEYNPETGDFENCQVSQQALANLDPLLGSVHLWS